MGREGGREEERIRGKAEFREREVGMKARRREGKGKDEKREREETEGKSEWGKSGWQPHLMSEIDSK